jgi:NaMN:DMB phosphoribosyltransferase
MNKQEAIKLLGGTTSAAADAIGVTYQAVRKWPDELPQRIADRVEAAISRRERDKPKRKQPAQPAVQAA